MDEQGILYIIIQGSPENRVAPHVAIATKALVGGGDITIVFVSASVVTLLLLLLSVFTLLVVCANAVKIKS